MTPALQPCTDSMLRFSRKSRVRRRADFLAARSEGYVVHSEQFIIQVRHRILETNGPARLGITATKKVGHAPTRNRIKRVVREVFRQHPELFPTGADTIFIAKRGLGEVTFTGVKRQVERAQSRLHGQKSSTSKLKSRSRSKQAATKPGPKQ